MAINLDPLEWEYLHLGNWQIKPIRNLFLFFPPPPTSTTGDLVVKYLPAHHCIMEQSLNTYKNLASSQLAILITGAFMCFFPKEAIITPNRGYSPMSFLGLKTRSVSGSRMVFDLIKLDSGCCCKPASSDQTPSAGG